MMVSKKLALIAPFLALGVTALNHPGRAQQPVPARFAFADTTLLRDTLDLKFDGLFELADSLRVLPDSLRALSIRYRLPLPRMVDLADSLRMPVDSVGPVMERERLNPLATQVQRVTGFTYTSGYAISRRSTTWTNGSDYGFFLGPLFIRNLTTISITRRLDRHVTDIHKSRSSSTEAGWRFSPDFSVGARVNLQGVQNFKPGSIYNNSESTNQFDFSIRSRQTPTPNMNSEVNFFGGPFNEPKGVPQKRGFSGLLSARLSHTQGQWLTQDISAQTSGRFGRARLSGRPWQGSRDLSTDVRGDWSLFSSRPLSMRVGFRVQHSSFDQPDTLTISDGGTPRVNDFVTRQPTSSRGLDVSMRYQYQSDRYIGLSESINSTQSILAISRGGRFVQDESTSWNQTLSVDGRYGLRGWSLDVRFSNGYPSSEQPRRIQVLVSRPGLPDTSVFTDVRERQKIHARSIDATVSKNLSRRIVFKAAGGVNLSSTTEVVSGRSSRTKDNYRQFYRLEGLYNRSAKMSTAVKLEVSRLLDISLLAASSASNTELRSYRAEWRWTYRLMHGLTATQQNQLTANYTYNPFAANKNRLSLDYLTLTTLNATVTPRFSIDVTHNARIRPSGGYTADHDGVEYFRPSDESRDYTMTGTISYAPSRVLRLSVQPTFQANDRDGTDDGVAAPNTRRRSLTFSGGASLNLPVGGKGRLTGNIGRTFQSSRYTKYRSGKPENEPPFEDDSWNGSLQFSWQL